MHNITIKVIINGTEIIPASPEDAGKLKLFNMGAKKGQEIEAYLTVLEDSDNKTAGQLAKAHALIREIANSTGHTNDEIKLIVKERAGLYDPATIGSTSSPFKSFADCTKQEMSKAIEVCIELGHDLGIYLY
jgi:hypothetical protein